MGRKKCVADIIKQIGQKSRYKLLTQHIAMQKVHTQEKSIDISLNQGKTSYQMILTHKGITK